MSELEAYRKINEPAIKLIQAAIRRSAGNVLLSPLNLMTTLMMAAVGARGEILRELAAAATVMCCPAGAAPVIRKVREFKADRPFVLLIRHKTTGLRLFAALIEDPS